MTRSNVQVYRLDVQDSDAGGYPGATKSIPLSALPPEAWRTVLGQPEGATGPTPESMHQRVPWLYRAVLLRCQALSDIPWSIYKGGKEVVSSEKYAPIPEAPWLNKLKQLLYGAELDLCLTGSAYWLKQANRVRTLGYRRVLPRTMKPLTSTENGLEGFERNIGNTPIPLDLSEVCYFWYPSTTSEAAPGVAPAVVALGAAGLIANVDAYAANFFLKGALNPTVLTVSMDATQEERDRLASWLKRVASGLRRAFDYFAIRGDVKVTSLGGPPKDLAMVDLTEIQQKAICVGIGVPYTLLWSEASNHATARSDEVALYTRCVLPEAEFIEETANEQVFGPIGLELRFHGERVDVIQQFHEGETFQKLALYAEQVITREEYRTMLGMPEQPVGATFAAGGTPPTVGESQGRTTGAEHTAATNALDDKAGEGVVVEKKRWEAKALKALKAGFSPNVAFTTALIPLDERWEIRLALAGATTEDAVKAAFLKTVSLPGEDGSDAERAALERKHATAIRKGLEAQAGHALPAHLTPATAHGAEHRLTEANGPLRQALTAALVSGVTLGADVARRQVEALWGVGTKAVLAPSATDTGGAGTVGIGVDWSLVNASALQWASQYAYDLVKQLDDTSTQVLQAALPSYISGDIDYQTLLDQIGSAFGKDRAERIAETEITRSFAEGNLAAWKASGVIKKVRWQTANDEHVCPTCAPLNGEVRTIEEGFDPNPPGHPRCRCWLSPVVSE